MSIALDSALYIRENEISYTDKNGQIHKFTASDRGYLFTIMFRVGSNPFTWISQKELAYEMDVTARPLKTALAKLVNFGLIEVDIDPKDARKNRYRPAEKLINYHDKGRIKGKKLSPECVTQDKKYGLKSAPIKPRKVLLSAPSRCRKQPLSKHQISPQPFVNKEKKRLSKNPKEKVNKQKSKETVKMGEEIDMMNFKMLKMNEAKKTLAQCPKNLALAKRRFEIEPSISMVEHLKNIINEIRSAS